MLKILWLCFYFWTQCINRGVGVAGDVLRSGTVHGIHGIGLSVCLEILARRGRYVMLRITLLWYHLRTNAFIMLQFTTQNTRCSLKYV